MGAGAFWALVLSPADWQQGETVRIMYVHVPMAWLAMGGYTGLAILSIMSLIWRHPLADLTARELSPVGAAVTALCLATGSLWGKPMWGTWWVWDARLTSVLVLFFLYLGQIALVRAFDEPERGYRAGAILALIGVVNLPIIKFSVDWWNTLHQPSTITVTGAPSMHVDMLWPLLVCVLGFSLGFAAVVTARLRAAVMERRIRGLLLAQAQGT
jgi:heme exporter protein C